MRNAGFEVPIADFGFRISGCSDFGLRIVSSFCPLFLLSTSSFRLSLFFVVLLLLSTAQAQLIVETNKQSPFVAIEIWVRAGTADETRENNGVAHFLEHMIFKGTSEHERGTLDAQVEMSGGLLGANTERDWTRFYTTVPVGEWQKTLKILLEHLKSPAIPADELEKERLVILRHEYARHESDPVRRLRYRLYEEAFEGDSYGLPVLGNPTVLEKLTREEILDFHRQHYLPSDTTIILTGNVTLQEAQAIVQEVLPQTPVVEDKGTEEKRFKAKRVTLVQEEKESDRVYIGYALPVPPAQKPEDVLIAQAFLELLTARTQGMLYKQWESGEEERDKPLPFAQLFSEYLPRIQGGIITLIFGVKPGQVNALKSHVEAVLERLHTLKQVELDSALARLRGHYIYEGATPGGRAYQLGLYHTLGLPDLAHKYTSLLQNISLSSVQQMVGEQASLVNLNFKPSLLNQERENLAPSVSFPSSSPNVERHLLANGMRVLIVPVPGYRTVSIQAFVHAGMLEEEGYAAGIGNLLMRLLFGTTQNETPGTLRYRVGMMGGSLNTYWEPQFTRIEMDMQQERLEAALSLLAEGLFRVDFESAAFLSAQESMLDAMQDPRDKAFRQAQTLALNALYDNQIYGQPFGGTTESIARITLQDIRRFYGAYYTTDNLVLVIAGDVKSERTLALARRFFEDFEPAARTSISPLSSSITAKTGLKEEKTSSPALYVMVAASMPGVEVKRYATARVLSAILGEGKGSRIFQSLREVEGIGYEFGSLLLPLRGSTPLLCYIQCGSENFPATLQRVREVLGVELGSLAEQPPPAQELNRAKRFVKFQYELESQRVADMAYRLGFWESLGLGYEQAIDLPAQVEGVTAQMVQEMAKECLRTIGIGVVTK